MGEKKDNAKEFSTCLEGSPCAEMMQKMMDHKGIGSLCAEMMKKVTEKQKAGGNFHCEEMMKSMMKRCHGGKENFKETKKEEGHGKDK